MTTEDSPSPEGDVGRRTFERAVSHEVAMRILSGVQTRQAGKSKAETVKERLEDLGVEDAAQNMKLRRHLAYGALGAVGVQLVTANLAFFTYGEARGWAVDPEVMIAWLTASVLEVVAILAIIARNLFPNGTT